jgi:Putative beta-barrel porin 2
MKSVFRAVVVVSACLMTAAQLSAQTTEAGQPGDNARFRWGPLRFTPSLVLNNIGVDTNVYNETTDPKQDTTGAVGPAVDLWLRPGRARLSGKASGQYLYFKKYDNQRGWNTNDELKFELPLSRLQPFAMGSYTNTHDRPGFEIDSRSRAATNKVALGTALRVSANTSIVLTGSRTITAFDQNATFLGATLAQELNRQSDLEQLQFRYQLTKLTTLVVNSDAIQDRFEFAKNRNADSLRFMPGFEFKPFALISGSVAVGFRHFNGLNEELPDYNGVVASVNARYARTATLVRLRLDRDLNFSYQDATPYYTANSAELELTQRLTQTWDVVGKGVLQELAYRQLRPLPTVGSTETGRGAGFGVGYWVGQTLRLSVEAMYSARRSGETARQYDGLRVGASVSYGILQ